MHGDDITWILWLVAAGIFIGGALFGGVVTYVIMKRKAWKKIEKHTTEKDTNSWTKKTGTTESNL